MAYCELERDLLLKSKGYPHCVGSERKIPAYLFGSIVVFFIVFAVQILINGLHNKDAQHRTEGHIGEPMEVIHDACKTWDKPHGIETGLYPRALKLFGYGIGIAKGQHGMSGRERIVIVDSIEVQGIKYVGSFPAFGSGPANDPFAYLLQEPSCGGRGNK